MCPDWRSSWSERDLEASRELGPMVGKKETEQGKRLTDPVANPPAPSKATRCGSISVFKAVREQVKDESDEN